MEITRELLDEYVKSGAVFPIKVLQNGKVEIGEFHLSPQKLILSLKFFYLKQEISTKFTESEWEQLDLYTENHFFREDNIHLFFDFLDFLGISHSAEQIEELKSGYKRLFLLDLIATRVFELMMEMHYWVADFGMLLILSIAQEIAEEELRDQTGLPKVKRQEIQDRITKPLKDTAMNIFVRQ